jgi:ketosteroid isomerase-like protein
LTSPDGRKYLTSVVKRGDSWAGVAIYRAAKKAISYQDTLIDGYYVVICKKAPDGTWKVAVDTHND